MIDKDVMFAATERRRELLNELREIDVFLKYYERFASILPDGVDESIDQNIGIPQKEFIKLAVSLLISSGKPMTSRQMLLLMKEHNINIGGADELRNLTTKLWRGRDEIQRLDGGAYWPKDFHLPPHTPKTTKVHSE